MKNRVHESGRLQVKRQLHVSTFPSVHIPQPSNADGLSQVWRDENGTEFALGYTVSGANYLVFPGKVVFTFSDNDECVVAVPETRTRFALIEDLFWRSALPLVLQMQGYGVLHASAVLTQSGIVGFCAKAGTGKSTLAYGLSLRGYPIWTDDAIVFDALEEPVLSAALPFKVRMRSDPADYFEMSQLGKRDQNYWQRDYQSAPLENVPVRAIIILRRKEDEFAPVSLNKISGAFALTELLEQAYAFSLRKVDQRRAISEQYMSLAAQVPTFVLHFPTGLWNLPLVLEQLERFLNKEKSLD